MRESSTPSRRGHYLGLTMIICSVIVGLALRFTGTLSETGLMTLFAAEALIGLAVAGVFVGKTIWAARRERSLDSSLPFAYVLEQQVAQRFPPLLGRILMVEFRGIIAAWLTAKRLVKRFDKEQDVVRARYHSQIFIFFMLAALADIPLFVLGRIALPPGVFRLALEVLGILGMAWLLMLCISLRHYAHEFGTSHVRANFANIHYFWLPSPAKRIKEYTQHIDASTVTLDDGILTMPMSNQTNIEIELKEPTILRSVDPHVDGQMVLKLHLWVDEPKSIVQRVKDQNSTSH